MLLGSPRKGTCDGGFVYMHGASVASVGSFYYNLTLTYSLSLGTKH